MSPTRSPTISLLLLVILLLLNDSCCRSRRVTSSFLRPEAHPKTAEDYYRLPKMDDSDIFGFHSAQTTGSGRLRDDLMDSSLSSGEEVNSVPDEGRQMSPPRAISKRRKGPTLSVVNPLEILRQRLMLDLARRRIHENQRQIVSNAQFLENIGKRSVPEASGRDSLRELEDSLALA